ncbi:MAG: AMP-binding protein [Bacteroidetes bacterium]|nr:AMP-binding protein [Bacteroidota bacterium]MBM3424798.1 AMP-binding protein [Bacteroidota bacterium]
MKIPTQVLPYQELFIRQEQAYGSSLSNQLFGIAIIKNASFDKLVKALEELLQISEWPYLRLSEDLTTWVIEKNQTGIVSYENKELPELSIDRLWAVSLFTVEQEITLKLSLHHALADAHSFQIFWEELKCIYEGKQPLRTISNGYGMETPSKTVDFGDIKIIEPIGLGPIERISINVSPNRKREIIQRCKEQQLNFSTLLLGCFQHFLDQIESAMGIPIQTGMALRNRSGKIEKQNFLTRVNFLPVSHVPISKISDLDTVIKNCFRNQEYPLLKWLSEERKSTAFNALFSYQKEAYEKNTDELQASFTFLPTSVDENIISMHVLEFGEESLRLSFDVRTDLADISFWRFFVNAYLNGVLALLDGKDPELNLPKAQLTKDLKNNIEFWSLFEKAKDNQTAIICADESITFGELKKRIRTEQKESPIIFLSPNRNIETIVKILKQWKHGGIISFTKPKEIQIPSGPFLYLAETSGSSGDSKEILIQKAGIETLLFDWKNRLNINENAIHLSLADMRFDVFFGDLFRSLFLGSTLVLATESERLSPHMISQLISKHQVSHLESTPSFIQLILKNNPKLEGLKHLVCGSEAITLSLYNAIKELEGIHIYNSYGLTEVSIDSALYPLLDMKHQFPLGAPLGDQQFTVHGPKGNIVPMGMWGELHISGTCVGTPLLKTERYIAHEDGTLGYKTGDRAFIHPIHGLIISGRMQDDFIKVNGKRIPARRIEHLIASLKVLTQCCVLGMNGASVLLHELNLSESEIRAYLSQHITPYQQPDLIQFNLSWPINQNGKIDKKTLSKQISIHRESRKQWQPKATEREQAIYRVLKTFEKAYGDSEDSLLAYGWNSIDLLSLCNELAIKGIHVPTQKVMAKPYIKTLLEEENSKNDLDSSHEINIDDLDMDDILGILNC